MASTIEHPQRTAMSQWLLLALIVSLGLMKPAVAYPIVWTDAIFLVLVAVLAVEMLVGRTRLKWRGAYGLLLLYVLSFTPSLLASPDPGQSAFKLATQLYLVALAIVTAEIVGSEQAMRRAALAWLAATGIVSVVAVLSLAAFAWSPDGALYQFSRFQQGTLPPGDYPRLSLTFFNANMLCNYLTVSVGLLLVAERRGWLSRRSSVLLGAGTAIAALSSISPGLGGIALLLGLWWWATRRGSPSIARLGLAGGVAVAALFVVATAVTPILHPTAPFLIVIPGTETVLAPSARYLTWSAAVAEFLRHPLVGHGIGIGAVDARYTNPAGELHSLTDAHNMFLNIAAQCGLIGLLGLAALIAWALRLTLPWRVEADPSNGLRIGLGLSFAGAFVYQGLAGSFEDSRHLWVLIGLMIAAGQPRGWK
jgi:O-antigen ligase